ncbi:MAG: HyaD/HybD family hydrogenase maturation endopeptidase [Proteobacteria bacterium]|nr:HyaD/HybD family hydrogenase maturation endopeptidase [Pseudomonadota bacterium]
MRVVVLGIGNTIMSDEGVGVHAVEALRRSYTLPDFVEIIDGGTSSMELLDDLADVDLLLVVDAVKAGKPEGTLVRLGDSEVPVFFRSKLSPHQIGLSDVMASLEFVGQFPKSMVVIGVQAENFELGLEMTPLIAARVPDLVAMVVAELAEHGIAALPNQLKAA